MCVLTPDKATPTYISADEKRIDGKEDERIVGVLLVFYMLNYLLYQFF